MSKLLSFEDTPFYFPKMMNKNKCVIFDLDGTLLYTLEDLKNSVNFALSKNGFKERSLDEVREFVGNGIENLIILKNMLPLHISISYFFFVIVKIFTFFIYKIKKW